MYTISLLPAEYRNHQIAARRNNRLLLIMLVATLSLGVVLATSIAVSAVYAGQLKRAEGLNAELTKQIDALKPVEQLQIQAMEMYTNIEQTAGIIPAWENVFSSIGDIAPPSIAIDQMSAVYSGENNSISISGSAFKFEDVTLYLDALSQINGFGDIQCQYSTRDNAREGLVYYEINILSLPAGSYELNLGGADHD